MQTPVNHPVPEEQQKTIKGKIWIVLVGINQYKNLSPLKFCANDCQDLAQAFELATKNFEDREIIALHDFAPDLLQPKQEHIHASIAKFALAQPEDTILFYFSGHGEVDPKENRPVLCLADTELNDLAGTGLLLDTLLEALDTSKARHKLVFLDACRSGSITTNPVNRVIDRVQQQVNQDGNLYAIVSCKKGQSSWEIPSLKHGAFTYCLIEGLRGRAANSRGLITASNLFNFIGEQIQQYLEYAKKGEALSGEKGLKVNNLKNQSQTSNSKQAQIPDYAIQEPECITRISKTPILGFATKVPRQALVINSLYTSETTLGLLNILQGKGGFKVDYCPSDSADANTIEASIISCLTSDIAETALLYLAGKVEETERNVYKLWLNDEVSLTFNWLRECLDNSAIKDKVIILDLWGATEVREFAKASQLGFSQKQCLIVSYAQEANSNRFLPQLVEILESAAQSEKELWLIKLITQVQTWSKDRADIVFSPLVPDFTDTINVLLPHTERSNNASFVLKRSPYKGLQAFTKNDAYFFHGRKELTEDIYNKLRVSNFLAVVGASGSGKSSVVQAGVLPLIEQTGLYQSGELKNCQTWVMRPDQKPFKSLARVLGVENELTTEGQLYLGIDSFISLLAQQPLEISVLIIDQFEELFTLVGENERKEFLELILGTVERASSKFKVVITLRDDFLKNCLKDSQLKDKIQQSLVLVSPDIDANQYREIIVEPAKKVGLTVEEGLVNRLLKEVKTGGLPLLEFALEELWMQRDTQSASLTLKEYEEEIGGLKEILEKKAQETYSSLSQEEQECAQWIFLSLVQLGEGQEDTRRRVTRSDLEVEKYAPGLVDSTLDKLITARLIYVGRKEEAQDNSTEDTAESTNSLLVSSQPEDSPNKIEAQTKVEVAHEILIRNWKQLRWWLEGNRQRLRLMREVGRARSLWQQEKRNYDYLLRGAALAQAEELLIKYSDEISAKDRQFIAAGIEEQDKQAKLAKRNRRRIIGSLTGGFIAISMLAGAALWQLRRATINEINALNNSSEALLESNQELDALITGLKAGKKIRNSRLGVDLETEIKTLGNLQNVFYKVKEFNRLENHSYTVDSVAIDPNSQLIISASGNILPKQNSSEIKLWNREGKLLHTLTGHENYVRKVVFSPDGKHIASAGLVEIKLWNRDGKLLHTLTDHENKVVFSPDGKYIASAGNEGTVKLWNREGKLLQTFKNSSPSQIAISPDSQLLAFDEQKTVRVWNREGKLIHTLTGHTDDVDSVVFSPDGQFLASASRDKTVKLWNKEGKILHTLTGHTGLVHQVLFSPDGQFLISASLDNTVKLWNNKGELLHTLAENSLSSSEHFKQIAVSPNSQLIAISTEDHTIELWNREGKLISTLHGHRGNNYNSYGITNLDFSPNGQFLVSAGVDNTVKLWNLQKGILYALPNTLSTEVLFYGAISSDSQLIAYQDDRATIKLFTKEGKLKSILQGHTRPLRHVTFSPDGEYIVSASLDNTAKLWNREGRLLHTLTGHTDEVFFVAISPNSKRIVSASFDNTMKLWDREGKILHTLTGHTSFINRVLFSSDGKYIVSASADNTVKFWNKYGTLLKTFEGHTDNVRDIAISPNGKRIVSASYDNTVKIWNKYGELLHTLTGHTDKVNRVLFSSDGKYIVSASADNTVKLWHKNGTLLRTLRDHTNNIYSLGISSDSKIIASGSEDGTVKLWSKSGKLLTTMEGHTTGVYQIVFSPDASFLFSASHKNDEVKLWSLDLNDVLERACDWTKDYLMNNPNFSQEDKKICL